MPGGEYTRSSVQGLQNPRGSFHRLLAPATEICDATPKMFGPHLHRGARCMRCKLTTRDDRASAPLGQTNTPPTSVAAKQVPPIETVRDGGPFPQLTAKDYMPAGRHKRSASRPLSHIRQVSKVDACRAGRSGTPPFGPEHPVAGLRLVRLGDSGPRDLRPPRIPVPELLFCQSSAISLVAARGAGGTARSHSLDSRAALLPPNSWRQRPLNCLKLPGRGQSLGRPLSLLRQNAVREAIGRLLCDRQSAGS